MTYTVGEITVSQYIVEAGGLATRVLDAGRGDRTLVCLHGAGSRADRFWHNLAPIAAHGHRVLALDFPGHGYASKGSSVTHSTPAFATFVTAVLRVLDVKHPVIVGTSLGGHVAAAIAVEEPDSVSALVLIGAVGIVPPEPREGPLSPVPMWDASPAAIRDKLHMVVARPELITDEWVNEEAHINSSSGAREVAAGRRRLPGRRSRRRSGRRPAARPDSAHTHPVGLGCRRPLGPTVGGEASPRVARRSARAHGRYRTCPVLRGSGDLQSTRRRLPGWKAGGGGHAAPGG